MSPRPRFRRQRSQDLQIRRSVKGTWARRAAWLSARGGATGHYMLSRRLADQFSKPSALVGPLLLAPIWNRRNRALNDAAFVHLDPRPTDRILDVGCGGGYLLQRIALAVSSGLAAGVDHSPAMVAYCDGRHRSLAKIGRLHVRCAGAKALPYEDGAFDKACSVNSAFYWDDLERGIAELWRVLSPDGRLVLCFTDKASLETKRFARNGLSLLEPEHVRQALLAASFWQVQVHSASDRHRIFWCLVASR
jgi:SAM-dependent methyltransferase